MNISIDENFVDLIAKVAPSSKLISIERSVKYFENLNSFVQDQNFFYYGTFNIGAGGSLSLSFLNSAIFIQSSSLTKAAITHPVLFDNLFPVKCQFTGYKIRVEGLPLNQFNLGEFNGDFGSDFNI